MNGKDIGGSIVKIGFAKVPAAQTVMTVAQALSNPSVLAAVVPGALERLEKQSAWKNNQTSATTESNLENVNDSNMYYSTGMNRFTFSDCLVSRLYTCFAYTRFTSNAQTRPKPTS